MPSVRDKVQNIEIVLKDIEKLPQTYETILEDEYDNGTYQVIVRRKLSKLCKSGEVCKSRIPGTRFGKTLFYCYPKKYHILIKSMRTGTKVYCFFKFKKVSRYWIEVPVCYKLHKDKWIKEKDLKFFEGNVLKWI